MSGPFAKAANSSLPLVVQVGFSGARHLLNTAAHPTIDPAKYEAAVAKRLAELIAALPAELGLEPRHFLCGISQIAVGGDTLFTRACRDARILQRIFLTQTADDYLSARGSTEPDFSETQRAIASELLSSPHVVERRVVSDAATRTERFQDATFEIARVSDVILVLVRDDQTMKAGGSQEMLEVAARRGIPALEIVIGVADGGASVRTTWHRRQDFHLPAAPDIIADAILKSDSPSLPSITDFGVALKELGSSQARWQRKLFTWAASIIILTHIMATVIAILAIYQHGHAISWLLGGELLLLSLGFGTHHYLRHRRAVEHWAMSRLVAEVARSIAAIGNFHIHLDFLFTLPFPAALRDVLRTLGVVHLRSTAAAGNETWQAQRDAYVHNRLVREIPAGQIPYHERTRDKAGRYLRLAQRVFFVSSVMAILSTLSKFVILQLDVQTDWDHEVLVAFLGALAILLPIFAVASLSLASAFDLEARYHISAEVAEFLHVQRRNLEGASTRREYAYLLMETETRLLGETVNWYVRRSFLGIA